MSFGGTWLTDSSAGPCSAGIQLMQHGLDRRLQGQQLLGSGHPHHPIVDLVVVVTDHVADPDDLALVVQLARDHLRLAPDASALGSMLIPAMEKRGYPRRFAAAVTAASSVIGPIIPPSIIMIVYAYVMQVSVAGLFLGSFILLGVEAVLQVSLALGADQDLEQLRG